MDNDILIPGIGKSPMSDKYEIKILICYILNSVNSPMSKQQLNDIFQSGQYVNYFSFCEAVTELIESGHISSTKTEFDEIYTLNGLGVETAESLSKKLPSSLRDNLVIAAIALLAKAKIERENDVKITKHQNGYNVECIMHEDELDFLNFKLFVPDIIQAEKIKERFLNDPTSLYKGLIGLLLDTDID